MFSQSFVLTFFWFCGTFFQELVEDQIGRITFPLIQELSCNLWYMKPNENTSATRAILISEDMEEKRNASNEKKHR